jgi:hypothetical protein
MSTNLAYAIPNVASPQHDFEEQPRRIRVITTRAQRRARPKATYGIVASAVVFAIFMAQLLLTISLSSGAYTIAGLQSAEKTSGRVQSSLEEKLHTLSSAQNLAANAQELGMVGASTPAYLRLSNGSVAGTPVPAAAGAPSTVANGSTDSVPNSLLAAIPVISPTNPGQAGSNASDSSVPSTESTKAPASKPVTTVTPITKSATTDQNASQSSDPNVLPSPNTH